MKQIKNMNTLTVFKHNETDQHEHTDSIKQVII